MKYQNCAETAQTLDLENAIANAAICACVSFCAMGFISLVYRYAPRQRRRRKFIAYFVAIAFCVACITASIFYANGLFSFFIFFYLFVLLITFNTLEFDGLQRETWMVVFGISIAFDSIILQTIRITITYFILACRRKPVYSNSNSNVTS